MGSWTSHGRQIFPTILFFLCLIILAFTTTPVEAGKCVKFSDYDSMPFWDMSILRTHTKRQVCHNVLNGLYDEFWVEDEHLNALTAPSMCEHKVGLVIDEDHIRPLSNLFTTEAPTSICQRGLLVQSCMYYYPKCDSKIDNAGVHVTKTRPQNKLCRWACEALREPGDLCSADDFAHLAQFGLDLKNVTQQQQSLPQFACENDDIFSDDESTCFLQNVLSANLPANRCEVYTGETCTFYGSSAPVYVDAAWTQEEVESVLRQQLTFLNVLPVNSQCVEEYTRNLCSLMFPDCTDTRQTVRTFSNATKEVLLNTTQVRRALQLRPPTSICESVNKYCENTEFVQYVERMGSQTFVNNCTESAVYGYDTCLKQQRGLTYNYLNRYSYQSSALPTPQANVDIVQQQFSGQSLDMVIDVPYYADCPWPLTTPESFDGGNDNVNIFGGRCVRSCPNPVITSHEREWLTTLTRVLSTVCAAFVVVLALSFVIFKSQRHKTNMLWYTMAYAMVPVTMMVSAFVGDTQYDFQCERSTAFNHFSGFGLWVGLFLTYFYICSTCWWLVNAQSLFLRLILGRVYRRGSTQYHRLQWAQHLFCWGVPAICVAALCCGAYIGYDGYLPFAFLTHDPSVANGEILPLEWIFFFLPVVLCATVGLIFILVVFVFLVRYEMAQADDEEDEQQQENAEKPPEPTPTPPQQQQNGNADNSAAADTLQSPAEQEDDTTQRRSGVQEVGADDTLRKRNAAAPDVPAAQALDTKTTTTADTTADLGTVDANIAKNKEFRRLQKTLNSNKGLFYKLAQSLKLFGFVFIMLIQIIIFLVYQVRVATSESRYNQDLQVYEECLLLVPASERAMCVLASRLNPGFITVGVISLLAPGFVMFLLYFIFSGDLWRLWCGLLVYKLGMTFLSSYATEDTITGTGSTGSGGSGSGSGSGRSGGSGSAGSIDSQDKDIFSGGKVFRKKGQNNNNNNNNTNTHRSNTNNNTTETTNGPDTSYTGSDYDEQEPRVRSPTTDPMNPMDKKSMKQRQEKRGQLFKGFNANKMDTPNYAMQQRRLQEYRRDSHHSAYSDADVDGPVVELCLPLSPGASPMISPTQGGRQMSPAMSPLVNNTSQLATPGQQFDQFRLDASRRESNSSHSGHSGSDLL